MTEDPEEEQARKDKWYVIDLIFFLSPLFPRFLLSVFVNKYLWRWIFLYPVRIVHSAQKLASIGLLLKNANRKKNSLCVLVLRDPRGRWGAWVKWETKGLRYDLEIPS